MALNLRQKQIECVSRMLEELLQRQEIMLNNIIYGATKILTGTELVEQLALLGQKMGLE